MTSSPCNRCCKQEVIHIVRNTQRVCFRSEVVVVREGFIKADLKNEVSLQKMRWKAEGQSHEVPQAEGSLKFQGFKRKSVLLL